MTIAIFFQNFIATTTNPVALLSLLKVGGLPYSDWEVEGDKMPPVVESGKIYFNLNGEGFLCQVRGPP